MRALLLRPLFARGVPGFSLRKRRSFL